MGSEKWEVGSEKFLTSHFSLLTFEGGVCIKGLVIAGTQSGCGKTTITLGLMASLVRRGLRVAPFKTGPDFIDPGHHTAVIREMQKYNFCTPEKPVVSRNLDGWMLSEDYNISCFQKAAEGADIAVVEGVMGLFDGYDGKSEAGSAAQMAKWLGIPVLLVVDAKSMARSAAALVQGFERFDRELDFAGVFFNNLGSERHLSYLKEAVSEHVNMPCLGGILREKAIEIPERHLGLFTSQDHPLSSGNVNKLADLIEKNMDVDALLRNPNVAGSEVRGQGLLSAPEPRTPNPERSRREPRIRIGIASDKAFCFYYQDNLDLLESFGAELVSFSPIKEDRLPENLDGLYFGGGYPELFAAQLADNSGLRKQIREKSRGNMPIYGECGGFMYLCREIQDHEGNTYPMTGCFPFITRMFPRLNALGYREITLTQDTIIGKRGQTVRGHEFHYSGITEEMRDIETVYAITDRSGQKKISEGYRIARTLGSYIHLHFGSQPDVARCFTEACLKYSEK